jgi:hypothetical protein
MKRIKVAVLGGVVLVMVPAGGIAIDRYTQLSSQAFLLYFTAIGALAAAAAAAKQIVETRRAVDAAFTANAIAETTAKRHVRPFIAVEKLRRSRGYFEALIKNHGGGVAIDIKYESAVLPVPNDPVDFKTFEDWRRAALRYDEAGVPEKSLGSAEERWIGFAQDDEITGLGHDMVVVYWRFSYSTLYEERESNETGPQVLPVAPALSVLQDARTVDGRAQLVLRLQYVGADTLEDLNLQLVDVYSWGQTTGWTLRSDWGTFPAQLKWSPECAVLGRLNPRGVLECPIASYAPGDPFARIADFRPAAGIYRLDLGLNSRNQEARYERIFLEWSPAALAPPVLPGDEHLRWVPGPE